MAAAGSSRGVAIRLGTEGKAQVKSDFGEVRQAGEAAFKGIGDAARTQVSDASTQFSRMAANYDRAVADLEAADRRRAATAAKLAVVMPETAIQSRINSSVGTGYGNAEGSAKASAEAFRQLLAEEDRMQAKASAIIAVLNPLAAAQDRYNREIAETAKLQAAGLLTSEQVEQANIRIKGELDQATAAHARLTGVAGQQRAGMQQLGLQLNDVATMYALGAKGSQIFASQSAQVIQSVQMMIGGTSKFAEFMQGPWGIALTAGVAVMLPLVATLLDTGEESEKTKGKTMELSDALQRSAFGTEAARKALVDYNAEQDKSRKNTADMIKLNLADAESRLKEALATRAQIAAEWERREKTKEDIIALGEDPGGADELIRIQKAKLAGNDAAIASINETIRNLHIDDATRDAKAAIDPLAKINNKYDDMAAAARRAAAGNDALAASLTKTLTSIEAQRKAALDAQRDADREARSTGGSSSADASAGDMTALLKELFPGVIVKDPKKHSKYVAGTKRISDHWLGRALDFIIPGEMSPEDFEKVKAKLLAAGIEIRRGSAGNEQFFGPGHGAGSKDDHDDHYHLAWKGNPSPESAARAAEAAADKAARRAMAFAATNADLDDQILAAKRAQITDIGAIATYEKAQVQAESDKFNKVTEEKVKLGDLTRAQADELEIKHAILSVLKTEEIDRKAYSEKGREALDALIAETDSRKTLLNLQLQAAKPQEERRKIQLELLALDKEEERQTQLRVLHDPKASDKERADATRTLGTLDQRYGLLGDQAMKDTAGPLEKYLNDVQLSSAQIRERVEGFAVDELESIRHGLDDAITRALGIKDPFLSAAIDLLVQQLIIRPLAEAMNNASSGSGGAGGFLSNLFGGIGAIFGGGPQGNPSGVLSLISNAHALGTEYSPGGLTWLAENGPEIVNLPRGSKVIPAAETRRRLAGANDNARPPAIQYFDLSGAVMTEDLLAEMDRRSQAAAQQATQAGITSLIDQNRRSYGALLSGRR